MFIGIGIVLLAGYLLFTGLHNTPIEHRCPACQVGMMVTYDFGPTNQFIGTMVPCDQCSYEFEGLAEEFGKGV